MAEANVNEEPVSNKATENLSEKKLSADAFQNFIQGKRHMLVQDYTNAVISLADACELYVEHFGQTAVECGEVYFHYGKALFRLFQQQAGIIGSLITDEYADEKEKENNSGSEDDKEKENTDGDSSNGNEDDDENEEEDLDDEELSNKDSSSKEVIAASTKCEAESSEQAGKSVDILPEASGDASATVESSETKTVADSHSEKKGEGQKTYDPELDKAGPSKPKTEEEISDLQLAWETLETAKAIFRKQGDENRDAQLKVAEILFILAEISMELENYEAAVGDLKDCLLIRERYLEPDDRLIAEVYYHLGLVHTFDSQVELALENYQKSIDTIALRIVNLKQQTVIQKTPEGFDINPEEEISELEAILPDIKCKMEDTRDMVEDTKNLMREFAFQSIEEAKAESTSSDKPVTNITHLLKRKKPDDQDAAGLLDVKKPKLSNMSMGDDQMKPQASTSSSDAIPNL